MDNILHLDVHYVWYVCSGLSVAGWALKKCPLLVVIMIHSLCVIEFVCGIVCVQFIFHTNSSVAGFSAVHAMYQTENRLNLDN